MSESRTIKHTLTTKDAVKFIKAAPTGAKFAIHVRIDLPVAGEEGVVFPDGGTGHLRISRKEAVSFVSRMLSETLEKRGGRIPLSVHEYEVADRLYRTLWIG
jgi:hypothetical protein